MHKTLYHESFGAGPDLVLLHGWGFHSDVWRTSAELLANYYRVTLIDLPGFGRSPLFLEQYDLNKICDLLLTVAPARAHWLGWSLGGLFAMQIASCYPRSVNKLICVASSPKFTADHQWPGMSPVVLRNFAEDLTRDYQTTLLRFLALQVGVDPTQEVKKTLKNLRERLFHYGTPQVLALYGGLALLENVDLRTVLKTLDCPSLFMLGKLDALVPVAMVNELKQLAPQVQVEIVHGANHAPFLSHADLFLQQLIKFLDDN